MNEINQGKFLKKKNDKAGSVDPKTLKYGTNNLTSIRHGLNV